MKDDAELKRWTAPGSEAPEGLRQLLAGGRSPLGTAHEVADLRERLSHVLAPQVSHPAPPPAAPLTATRWAPWAAAGVGLGAAGMIWLLSSSGEAPPSPAPAAPIPPAAPVQAPPAPPAETQLEQDPAPPPAAIEPATPPAEAAPRKPAPRRSPPKATATDEAELLERAQAALQRTPARALQLTDEHARRFRRGLLREEREVIAIEALGRLGREAAARRRAAQFEQRYPSSVHLDRVHAALK